MDKKAGKINPLFILDAIGFLTLLVGAALIRYAKDEVVSILGGLVMAIGATILGLARFISK